MTELNLEINIPNVRISYPHLFEKFGLNGGTPKYSAKLLLHKTEHAALIKAIAAKIKEAAAANFKDKKLPGADKLCLRDGDQSGREEEAGFWTLSASEDTRPVVVDRNRAPLAKEDDVIYPGCRVNAKVRLWCQDNKFGRRVNANLLGVQFVKDDERLGSGRSQQSADDMFEDIGDAFGDDGADGMGDDNPF